MMNARFVIFCLSLLLPASLSAREKTDVIVMKNGDRITCEIKGLTGDTLYIGVDYILGTSSVDWSKVDHIESKQLFIVKTQNGMVYTGSLSTSEASAGSPVMLQVLNSSSENKTLLDKSQVIQMDETSTNFWQRLNGNVGLGVIYSKGNQSTQYNLNSAVAYTRERWGTSATYDSTLASSTGTSPATRNEINLSLQHLLGFNNWYYSGIADFLQSSAQGIQLQSSTGGAIGRHLMNNNRTRISLFAGLVWQRINYAQNLQSSPTQEVASSIVGAEIKLFNFNKTSLAVNSNLLPALSEPGRVHFNLNASYYVKLHGNLNWNFSFYGNWDNRPPPGFSGSDYGTSSGLTWKFGSR